MVAPPDAPGVDVPQIEGFGRSRTLVRSRLACRIVDVDELPESGSSSIDAWRALADDPASTAPLPAAAHAVCNRVGDAVVSAEYARATFLRTRAAQHQLRDLVTADLRDYQLRGVTWLEEAAADGGGVLADEMGLGKTLQAIAHLAHSGRVPALVVCPTGLVTNWLREIARWAPGRLRAVDYRGGPLPGIGPGTVVVAGYPTLRRHFPDLSEFDWATIVFDEAQALKNSRTQVSRAARTLRASSRLALTGTPVENDLDEL
ncbi:MAG: SNF2-related protein, partial [Gordonia sp. (in: high G+C Gram-positive bacteria)]